MYNIPVKNGAFRVALVSAIELIRKKLAGSLFDIGDELYRPVFARMDAEAADVVGAVEILRSWLTKQIELAFASVWGGPSFATSFVSTPPSNEIYRESDSTNDLPFAVPLAPQPPAAVQQPSAYLAPVPADENIYFLTGRVDTLIGAEGNNTFVGARGTVRSNDTLKGGSGFNVADLTLESSPSQVFARYDLLLEKIEQLNIAVGHFATNFVPIQLSASRWTAIEEIRLSVTESGRSPTISIEHLQINPTLAFSHFTGTVFADYLLEASTGTLSIVLDDQSNVRLSILPSLTSFDRIDITSSGSGANVALIDIQGATSVNPHAMFLFGNARLEVIASDHEFSNLMLVDATNLAGGFILSLDGAHSSSVRGGNGNDQLTITNTVDRAFSFDGGAGIDTVTVDIGNANLVAAANFHSVEHLIALGELGTSSTITNLVGFSDIYLTNPIGHAIDTSLTSVIRLVQFDKITLGADVIGKLTITSTSPTALLLERDCDIVGSLDLSSASNVTISADSWDTHTVVAALIMESNAKLRFSGDGAFVIEHVDGLSMTTDVGTIVDLSNLSGGFDNNFKGAEFGNGSDFLVGDLHRDSSIRLDTSARGTSEIVFGNELHTTVTIYNLGYGDHIDLGQLGVSKLADLNISYSLGVSHIVGDSFFGQIDVVGIDLTSSARALSLLDFNGHIG